MNDINIISNGSFSTFAARWKTKNLSVNDASDVAQNRPLSRLMSTFGAMQSYWCMPQKKKKKKLPRQILLWVPSPSRT